jgi:hypothetical protein
MRKQIGLIAVLASLSAVVGLMSATNMISVHAQVPQFPNNTETASEFADVIEGNDTTIIENDTNIGNTNNT